MVFAINVPAGKSYMAAIGGTPTPYSYSYWRNDLYCIEVCLKEGGLKMGYGDSSASKFLVGVQKSDFDSEVAARMSAQAELVAVRTNKFGATFSTVSERVAAIENGVIDLTNSPRCLWKNQNRCNSYHNA